MGNSYLPYLQSDFILGVLQSLETHNHVLDVNLKFLLAHSMVDVFFLAFFCNFFLIRRKLASGKLSKILTKLF